jgi:hypothetical protein
MPIQTTQSARSAAIMPRYPTVSRALGDQLPKDIEMIVSGHIHKFQARSFADAKPPQPPQLVVGTGGVRLAKKPNELDEVGGVPVSDALILKRFAYMVWDSEGSSWRGVLLDQNGAQLARCKLADRQLTCKQCVDPRARL